MRLATCLRAVVRHGFRWAYSWLGRVGMFGGVTVLSLGTVALHGDALLVLSALVFAVLCMLGLGAFRAWDEADRRSVAAEKRQAELQERVAELERQPQTGAITITNYIGTQVLLDREDSMAERSPKRLRRHGSGPT